VRRRSSPAGSWGSVATPTRRPPPISILSHLAAWDARAEPTATRVLDWTLTHMVRADGRFAFQRHRHRRDSTAYVRWSDAHMLLALADVIASRGPSLSSSLAV